MMTVHRIIRCWIPSRFGLLWWCITIGTKSMSFLPKMPWKYIVGKNGNLIIAKGKSFSNHKVKAFLTKMKGMACKITRVNIATLKITKNAFSSCKTKFGNVFKCSALGLICCILMSHRLSKISMKMWWQYPVWVFGHLYGNCILMDYRVVITINVTEPQLEKCWTQQWWNSVETSRNNLSGESVSWWYATL